MTSHVERAVAERIAAARRKAERKKRRREELAAARTAGVARRHTAKLRHQTEQRSADDPTVMTFPEEGRAS